MIQGPPNTAIPLRLTLGPAYTDRYVRVYIERIDGTLVTMVDLEHTRFGTYTGYFIHTLQEYLIATFVVYKNEARTILDVMEVTGEEFRIINDPPTLDSIYSFANRMTTVFKTDTGHHEIVCWADKNDQRVISATECTITVKNSLGAVVYTDYLETPNADGIFRFEKLFSPGADENFYVIIAIRVDGEIRTSNQSFFTLG